MALFALVLVAFFAYTFLRLPFNLPGRATGGIRCCWRGRRGGQQVQAVAWNLFTQSLLPFEIASLVLLVAMIGAVVLGRRQ